MNRQGVRTCLSLSLPLLILAIAMVVTTAASGSSKKSAASTSISIRLPDDYDTIDPATSKGTFMGYEMRMFLYDRLVEVNEKGHLVPHLATSWKVTPTAATLKIRKGVTCSDGSTLTPSAIAASLTRLGAPATKAIYAYRTFGSGGLKSAVGNDGAGTVTITLKKPYSDLMLGLSMWWASIVCQSGTAHPSTLQNSADGSGPYTLTKSHRGDSYTLTARKGYNWGPQGATTLPPSAPTTVVLRYVQSESTAANLMLSGGLNVAYFLGADTDRVAAKKGLYRLSVLDNGGYAMQFNEKAGLPGADPKFRHAIEMAIDPQSYNKAATFGHGKVFKTLYSPNLPCYNAADGAGAPKYSLAAAKTLLAQDGWTKGSNGKLEKNGKPVTLRFIGYTDENSGPDYILSVLQSLGFNTTFRKPNLNGWIQIAFTTGDWDITPYPYSSAFPSPGLFAGQIAQASIKNPGYSSNVAKALSAPPAKACGYWDAAERAMINRYDGMNLSIPVYSWFGQGVKFRAPNNLIWPTTLTTS